MQLNRLSATTVSETSGTTAATTPLAIDAALPIKSSAPAVVPKTVVNLMVFVVDTSMPNGPKRIAAVKGSIATLLPKTKVAVVSCFGDEAELTLEPTSSFISACRKLMTMQKSVMGNLGAGLDLAVKTSEDALRSGVADRVIMAVVADGKAHGLLTGTSDCEVEADVCDLELMNSAVAIQTKTKELEELGYKMKTVIVDTEAGRMVKDKEWSEEGAKLASLTGADYYHLPDLTDTALLRYKLSVHSASYFLFRSLVLPVHFSFKCYLSLEIGDKRLYCLHHTQTSQPFPITFHSPTSSPSLLLYFYTVS